jgi:hypothetical protein
MPLNILAFSLGGDNSARMQLMKQSSVGYEYYEDRYPEVPI